MQISLEGCVEDRKQWRKKLVLKKPIKLVRQAVCPRA
jgi:hypothetical protein